MKVKYEVIVTTKFGAPSAGKLKMVKRNSPNKYRQETESIVL